LLCFPIDRAAYGRLSCLLSLGRRRAVKGECILHLSDLEEFAEGQIVVALPYQDFNFTCHSRESGNPSGAEAESNSPSSRGVDNGSPLSGGRKGFSNFLNSLARLFPGRAYLAAQCLYSGDDGVRLRKLARLSREHGLPLVATNDVHYHAAERR